MFLYDVTYDDQELFHWLSLSEKGWWRIGELKDVVEESGCHAEKSRL